jgi:hypothetical protein
VEEGLKMQRLEEGGGQKEGGEYEEERMEEDKRNVWRREVNKGSAVRWSANSNFEGWKS